jgi:hypothetical protein
MYIIERAGFPRKTDLHGRAIGLPGAIDDFERHAVRSIKASCRWLVTFSTLLALALSEWLRLIVKSALASEKLRNASAA